MGEPGSRVSEAREGDDAAVLAADGGSARSAYRATCHGPEQYHLAPRNASTTGCYMVARPFEEAKSWHTRRDSNSRPLFGWQLRAFAPVYSKQIEVAENQVATLLTVDRS